MKTTRCRRCDAEIAFVLTPKNRRMPVNAKSVTRNDTEPLSRGKYVDRYGTLYNENTAPVKVELWKAHWGDCIQGYFRTDQMKADL